MLGCVMIVLGIIADIINTNGWFIIPQYASRGLFIVGFLVLFAQLILSVRTHNTINKRFKR